MARSRKSGIKLNKIPVRSVASIFDKQGKPLDHMEREERRRILTPKEPETRELEYRIRIAKLLNRLDMLTGKTSNFSTPRDARDSQDDIHPEENPDMDMYTKATRAVEKHEKGPDKPIHLSNKDDDFQLRRTQLAARMNKRIREHSSVIVVKDKQGKDLSAHKAQQHFKEQAQINYLSGKKRDKDFDDKG